MKIVLNLINDTSKVDNPVVIGGIGGSGRRLVAEILEQIGFYIGKELKSEMIPQN